MLSIINTPNDETATRRREIFAPNLGPGGVLLRRSERVSLRPCPAVAGHNRSSPMRGSSRSSPTTFRPPRPGRFLLLV
jgi:hypothetical protein